MNRSRTALHSSLFLCSVVVLSGYSMAASKYVITQDPQAVAVMQASIAALGGSEAISQISDCTVQGSSTANPADPTETATFVWQIEGSEFRYDTQTSTSESTFLSGHGNPGYMLKGKFVPVADYMTDDALPYHLPGLVLLNDVGNPNYSIVLVGVDTWNGTAAVHIQIVNGTDPVNPQLTQQDWYLDPSSLLPIAVAYVIPNQTDPTQFSAGSITFANYKQVGGLLVPFAFTVTVDQSESVTVTSATFNSGIPATTFDGAASGGAQ
jgi:hypothetical protein